MPSLVDSLALTMPAGCWLVAVNGSKKVQERIVDHVDIFDSDRTVTETEAIGKWLELFSSDCHLPCVECEVVSLPGEVHGFVLSLETLTLSLWRPLELWLSLFSPAEHALLTGRKGVRKSTTGAWPLWGPCFSPV